jgi:hypothetical protein
MSSPYQTILEGLVSDILNEQFGEVVELVGIALMRFGAMSFLELVKTVNMNILAFPRDSVNQYNILDRFSEGIETVGVKTVRDALLVLIHYDLVSFESDNATTKYTLRTPEVLRRLQIPFYLESFDESERTVVERIIMRGRVCMAADFSKDEKSIVQELIGTRILKTVDSVVVSSPKKSPKKISKTTVVVAPNMAQMEFGFLKSKIVEFLRGILCDPVAVDIMTQLLDACSPGTTPIASVSIGELSLNDLMGSQTVSQQHVVGALIKLQSLNFVRKQVGVRPVEDPVPKKKPRRALNTKQVIELAEEPKDSFDILGMDWGGGSPMYAVRLTDLVDAVQHEILAGLMRAKYGESGHRIFELLLHSGQKLEATHIADICAISREEALKYLHIFSKDGLAVAQEVPKVSVGASATSAGGLSAVMRAVASSFWLYSIETDRVKNITISLVMQSIINLRRRFRHEVLRLCKIEDRAGVPTEAQDAYLERVHDAQDTMEAAAINLVSSLVFLGM